VHGVRVQWLTVARSQLKIRVWGSVVAGHEANEKLKIRNEKIRKPLLIFRQLADRDLEKKS
jgi:hypothetical protein